MVASRIEISDLVQGCQTTADIDGVCILRFEKQGLECLGDDGGTGNISSQNLIKLLFEAQSIWQRGTRDPSIVD